MIVATRPFSEFDAIISKHLVSFGSSPSRSSNKSPARQRLDAGAREDFWREGADTKMHWSSNRTAGYLAGYVEFCRSSRLPGQGIPVNEGFVQLDKGVVCALLVGECLRFDNQSGHLVLTPKGEALIAPFVQPSVYRVAD